jgi:hypothetical protein
MNTREAVRELTVVDDFVSALGRLDFAALATTLSADVRFHALVPPGFRQASGSDATAAVMRGWFADSDRAEIGDYVAGVVGDRPHAGYRIRAREGGEWQVAEQRLVCTIDGDGKIATLDFLCSGFHPELAGVNP